jgi:hypothetical protein
MERMGSCGQEEERKAKEAEKDAAAGSQEQAMADAMRRAEEEAKAVRTLAGLPDSYDVAAR